MNTSDFGETLKQELETFQYPDLNMDFYRSARNSHLECIFPDYPEVKFDCFKMSFIISSAAKNALLVYAILEHLPDSNYSIDINKVSISIDNENCFINHIQEICDLLNVVGSWKSLQFSLQDRVLNRTDFSYLVSYIEDRNKIDSLYSYRNVNELKKIYISGQRHRTKTC